MKLVFKDIGGLFPWPYVTIPNQGTTLGIQIDENGTQGAFYFEFDSMFPEDTYFLEVYDRNGVLQWTMTNFFPPAAASGGSVTTAVSLENLVVNNVFWRNIGNSPVPINQTYTRLAPSSNTGLANTPALFGGDIVFIKQGNLTATDQLQFKNFIPGTTPFNLDVTPIQYLNYTSNMIAGETAKYIQIPITQGVQNLNNISMTFSMWAESNGGGNPNLTVQLVQFFGDGGAPSAPVIVPIDVYVLTNNWVKNVTTFPVPDIIGKTLGFCGNDGLFLQILFPVDSSVNIDLTKPSLYVGNIAAQEEYQAYDKINAVINSPRTGDSRISYSDFIQPDPNWIRADDGTIGAPLSGASTRAAIDTFPLYNLIWNTISRTFCPVVGGAGVSAIADFVALKSIFLPRALGRNLAATISPQQLFNFTADFATGIITISSGNLDMILTGSPLFLTTTGSLPAGLLPNTVYYIIKLTSTTLKLATTYANAIALVNDAVFTNNGAPINTINYSAFPLGYFEGERHYPIPLASLPNHTHTASSSANSALRVSSVLVSDPPGTHVIVSPAVPHTQDDVNDLVRTTVSTTVNATGSGQPFTIVPPTTYINMFIKL
jgi:hypothetical protein